ncbi:MAG: hypothetical protein U9O98_02795 [Asgard group archaeon]|nr:hypothetical protein [Asgard group archaeon]
MPKREEKSEKRAKEKLTLKDYLPAKNKIISLLLGIFIIINIVALFVSENYSFFDLFLYFGILSIIIAIGTIFLTILSNNFLRSGIVALITGIIPVVEIITHIATNDLSPKSLGVAISLLVYCVILTILPFISFIHKEFEVIIQKRNIEKKGKKIEKSKEWHGEKKAKAPIHERLLDPITILGFLMLINFIVILIQFLGSPIYQFADYTTNNQTNYFWLGNYRVYNITNGNFLDKGTSSNFPIAITMVFLINLILLILLTLYLLSVPLFKPKIIRQKLINNMIWPNFIGNFITISCYVAFSVWINPGETEQFSRKILLPMRYALWVSILLLILTVVVAGYLTSKNRKSLQSTNNAN